MKRQPGGAVVRPYFLTALLIAVVFVVPGASLAGPGGSTLNKQTQRSAGLAPKGYHPKGGRTNWNYPKGYHPKGYFTHKQNHAPRHVSRHPRTDHEHHRNRHHKGQPKHHFGHHGERHHKKHHHAHHGHTGFKDHHHFGHHDFHHGFFSPPFGHHFFFPPVSSTTVIIVDPFCCALCDLFFATEAEFYDHLFMEHYIPQHEIPDLVVQRGSRTYFYGR